MANWSARNCCYLGLLTLAYILGEVAHFLINTTSRAVARDVHFGDLQCYGNTSSGCSEAAGEAECGARPGCSWDYSGLGYQYQLLAGPAFVAVFSVSGVLVAVTADRLRAAVSRVVLVGLGTATFSAACLLMGLATAYWQLVLLRMLIAAGESVCRPMASAVIADLFSASARGVANGIFSWGVYLGFGLAFVLGIDLTAADLLGRGWRAVYVVAGAPGLLAAATILLALRDPPRPAAPPPPSPAPAEPRPGYLGQLWRSFARPAVLTLLAAAMARHTAGYSWAYNTRLYFQTYHPDFDIGYWILLASCVGGSFGVFAGGFFSDRLVGRLGLHSRLWLLAACTLAAAPLAAATLYLEPPGAMGALLAYYLFAETWFAILFTVIVEVVEAEVRATCIALFLFCMNQVGGNLPVLVTPLHKLLGDYRLALALAWPGCLLLSSGLFLLASVPLWRLHKRRLTTDTPDTAPEAAKEESPEATQPLLDLDDETNKD